MNSGWDYAVSSEALHVISTCKPTDRRRVIAVLQRLLENPGIEPEASCFDRVGRKLSIVRLGGVRITFWVDHFGKEVRVTEILLR